MVEQEELVKEYGPESIMDLFPMKPALNLMWWSQDTV